MEFQTPLIEATLERRYKRFLADIILPDGTRDTAHCPNPGSMMGLCDTGTKIWVMPVNDPRKKLRYSWQVAMSQAQTPVWIDTGKANAVVKEALLRGQFDDLMGKVDHLAGEPRLGDKHRADFLAQTSNGPVLIEVKSVSLSRAPSLAEFPDSVTARGSAQTRAMCDALDAGAKIFVLYVITRADCTDFALAHDIDPTYAQAQQKAKKQGLRHLLGQISLTKTHVELENIREID